MNIDEGSELGKWEKKNCPCTHFHTLLYVCMHAYM